MEGSNKVAGLVLAAGASTRMGKPKQLLRAGGRTLLERSVEQALGSALDRVVLVLGHQAGQIKRTLGESLYHPKLKVVVNRAYHRGISSSIITGLKEIEQEYPYVMIILADMPCLQAGHINRLLQEYLHSPKLIGALKVHNRRTHPVVFHRKLYPELHQLRNDVGARSLFAKYGDQVRLVEAPEGYNDRDIDTPADYRTFREEIQKD
jgi:molybdenum cofactor cytidylyltransferase